LPANFMPAQNQPVDTDNATRAIQISKIIVEPDGDVKSNGIGAFNYTTRLTHEDVNFVHYRGNDAVWDVMNAPDKKDIIVLTSQTIYTLNFDSTVKAFVDHPI